MKRGLHLAILAFLQMALATAARAQDAQIVLRLDGLQVRHDSTGDTRTQVDLLHEIRRVRPHQTIDTSFNRVEVWLKSDTGGAGVFLVVNGAFVDGRTVESDPASFQQAGQEPRVVLKNSEGRVQSAQLLINGPARVRAIVVVPGAAEEIVLQQTYTGTDGRALRPPEPRNPAPETEPRHAQPAPPARPVDPAPALPSAPRPPPVADARCLQGICIGDTVVNNFGIEGKVLRIHAQTGRLEVQFPFSDRPTLRTPGQVRKK